MSEATALQVLTREGPGSPWFTDKDLRPQRGLRCWAYWVEEPAVLSPDQPMEEAWALAQGEAGQLTLWWPQDHKMLLGGREWQE
jgi:hypothetical protein